MKDVFDGFKIEYFVFHFENIDWYFDGYVDTQVHSLGVIEIEFDWSQWVATFNISHTYFVSAVLDQHHCWKMQNDCDDYSIGCARNVSHG